jgi:MFS family permease
VTERTNEQDQEVVGTNARAASWLAWSVCAAILTVLGLSVLLIFLGWSTPLPGGWTPWGGQLIGAAGGIGAPILGGLIASRRPGNPYGWLWLGFGLAVVLVTFAQAYAAYALEVEPGFLPAPRTVGAVVAGGAWTVAIASIPFLLLLFPTGRLPSRRWRFVTWAVALAGGLALIVGPFDPAEDVFLPGKNPLGVGGTIGEAMHVLLHGAVIVVLIALVPSALSLVLRYRRAGGVERQQLKWFAYAAVVWIASFLVEFFYEPPGAWDALYETVLGAGLYVAVGVAILKHRLYDIDLLINRTLVYGSLTAMLALVYVGGVVGLQAILRAMTGQESTLVVVASTLAIAALFSPLRRRVQGFVDRRFYRRKYDATKTLAAFNTRLREETDLASLSDELVGVVSATMQPEHVSLWLRPVAASEGEQSA